MNSFLQPTADGSAMKPSDLMFIMREFYSILWNIKASLKKKIKFLIYLFCHRFEVNVYTTGKLHNMMQKCLNIYQNMEATSSMASDPMFYDIDIDIRYYNGSLE